MGSWAIYAYCESEKKTINNKRKHSIINLEVITNKYVIFSIFFGIEFFLFISIL